VLGLEKAGAIPISEATFGKSGQTHGMIDAESKMTELLLSISASFPSIRKAPTPSYHALNPAAT
jgi:hypothetical protein